MDHWNNKSLVRAMAIESFKMFKPSAYNLIKADYGEYSGDFDDEFLLSSDWCPNHLTKIDKPKMEVEADKNHYTETRFAEFELRIVNSVKACIKSTLEKSSTNTAVAFSGLFKCVICFSRPNSCMPILWTLRKVFFVLIKSRQMSVVQKKFSCLKCTGILPRNPLLIPDIEKLVNIPPTRSNALKPPSESEDSDDTLPAVDFNHATQPSSANTNVWLLEIILKKLKKKILIK